MFLGVLGEREESLSVHLCTVILMKLIVSIYVHIVNRKNPIDFEPNQLTFTGLLAN